MKILRFLTKFLFWAVVLVVLLAVISIAPVLQTWVAQRVLDRQTGVHGSIEALSARFGEVQLGNLHLEFDGAVLTVPYLEAHLPLTTALWQRKFAARSLVARGWTLDLSHRPEPAEAQTPAVAGSEHGAEDGGASQFSSDRVPGDMGGTPMPRLPAGEGGTGVPPVGLSGLSKTEMLPGAGTWAQTGATPARQLLHAFRELLRGAQLPCDVSLDEVDLEGDVLIAHAPGNPPTKVHVIVKGDGVAAGREGTWTIDAAGRFPDSWLGTIDVAAHGHLNVVMDSPRTVSRVEIKADLTADGRSLPNGLAGLVDVVAARGVGEETYTIDVSRDSRRLATFLIHAPAATDRLAGTWKIALRESDLAPFVAGRALPLIAAEGEGTVETDTAFTRVHTLGRLTGEAGHWGVLVPPLDFIGTVTMDAGFDLVHRGQSLRVDRLEVSIAGPGRAAVVRSLQPFDLDERTGHLTMTDPHNDWLEASLGAFPLAGLPGLPGGFTFAAGMAKGKFVVRLANGGFSVHSKIPSSAADVTVLHAGKMVGHGLDLSLSLLADHTPGGWQLECAPLIVASAGQRLATLAAKTTWPAKADEPITVAGTWDADLKAWAAQSAIPGTDWITARSASGDFSASFGAWTKIEGKLAVVGPAADQTISANFQADVGGNLSAGFHAPVKIAVGSSVSELTADGTWAGETAGNRVEVRLTGPKVALEHLQLLAAPLAAMGGVPRPVSAAAGGRDPIPFWGNWVGTVTVAFDHLQAADEDRNDVRGLFEIDRGSIRLQNGLWELPNHSLAKAEGSLSFDPAAALPYGLKATASLGEVDAAPLFGDPPSGRDPAFKGHFSVATTLTGHGVNLADLIGRIDHEYRLTSTNGIIRLLRTNVADTIAEPSAPVSDALDTAGSAVGAVFGLKRKDIKSRENHVSKNTEAVLDFTYAIAEIGYDQLSITATQGSDHTIHLVEIAMTSRDTTVTGSGQIGYVKGWSLATEPLSVDLQLGARGKTAGLLATAGLLSSRKDAQGYTMLNQPIHFGGTLQHIDETQWHDLLAKAAVPKPEEKKKDAPPTAPKK